MKLTKNDWFGAGAWTVLTLGLWFCLLCMTLGSVAGAQAISTTTVQGTVYLANGQVGTGTLFLSWPAFTTANGQSVAADKTTVTIAPDGFVSVSLAPNQGATPAGLYYTAVYYLNDGTTTTQYWVVPAAAQASLAQVQAQLMPAAQAVQAVSKAYVDQAIAEAEGSQLLATGGTLTGPLYLNGDPTQPLQAADKHYVDTTFSEAVPLAGGNMTGALQSPAVNGEQSPLAGSSQTTLQAALNAAGTNGAVQIPPTYTGTDGFINPNGLYVKDLRPTTAQQQERSVKEFGAVCDGATDDTSALQSALNYANAHSIALTIPQGTCKTRSLNWRGESIGGLGKQVSALMGFPGQDILATGADSVNLLSYTRIHDLTIYVDQSIDVSCSAARGRATAGICSVSRLMEKNSIFSPGGNGLTNTQGIGTAWAVGNCAIAMPASTGAGGNGLRVAEIENLEIATTGVDPMATQYPGAHSTHTCGLYLAQWPQWSEFRNIDIRGLNTGIAIPGLPGAAPAGLNSDSNRWQNITIQAVHAFTAAAGSNNVLDNVVALAGNSASTGEPPTGLVLDLGTGQQGWTVRNAVVLPAWNAVQPQLAVTASGGAVTSVTAGPELGLGFDPYGTQVPLKFSGSCTALAVANVNSSGALGAVSITQGGVGCSGTTTASVNASGIWDTAAPVNLIAGQNMTFFAGNLLKGNGGYTVWNAASSQANGTQLNGGGGNLPGGGTYAALVANNSLGTAFQVDQFPGSDFGGKLQACLGAVSAVFGGTCDARNFTGSQSMGSNLTISTANTAVLLPCATISTANQVIVTAGTRNVSLRGCALRGGTAASGSQGGTAFLYSGTGAMVQVGDPTYAADTSGFHMEDLVINTTAATSATAQGFVAYRAQELDLESLYFLGNQNQTGMTLDGTGNYTGGTFFDDELGGFLIAVNAIGHQASNPAATDWMNASTFVRLHIDCPTSAGSPIAGTYGVNLLQGDGNTFTGGDIEGCNTALHLGPNAQNNTIVGLRNEVSNNQVVADTGSSYNSWMTGGTMFTGKLTDAGTRNSFLDTFHRSFNGLNGDWYGSQQDATVTNHFRLGIGLGNERGLQERYQTDFGYRWTTGLSDAAAGEQFYQILDELNAVNRLSIGQYNNGQSSTNNQTVVNAAGSGAVILNGSNNSGTGGVVFGSGGLTETTVATIDHAGNAQLNGTLQVAGTSQSTGTMTVRNNADSEVDYYLWPGLTGSQKGSFTYKDWNGNSQWYMVKDASNNWSLNSALGGLDSFKAYQSTNSGDTYVNASNLAGVVRVNYESGSGAGFNVYGGSSSSLYASFTGTTAIKFPGLAAASGHYCAQFDSSGYLTNTGSACGTSSGSGSVTSVGLGLPADFTVIGSPITGGGTLTAAWANESAGMFHAGPSSGGATTPTWRTIVAADIPTLNQPTTANAGTATALASVPGQCSGSNYATGIGANGAANCAQVSYAQISGTPTGGGSGAVSSGTIGQIAFYAANGTTVGGTTTVSLTAGGTGATTASGALVSLGGMPVAGGTMTGALTVRNSLDAEVDSFLWAGLTASQKESLTYKDWNGTAQWYTMKDASNNWELNSATGGLDSFKAYQSTNSGDTYVDASNPSGVVRVNYETGAGAGFKVYGGSSSSLYASFTGTASIEFPGLAAGTGHSCLQVDTSGYVTNSGSACGTGSGGVSGTVSSATTGQIAYYTGNGSSVGGVTLVPLTAGGTGASTAPAALSTLGAQAAIPGLTSDGLNGIVVPANGTFGGNVAAVNVTAQQVNNILSASSFAGGDCGAKINAADSALGSLSGEIDVIPGCGTTWTTQVVLSAKHNLKVTQAATYVMPGITVSGTNIVDLGGSTFQIAPYSTSNNTGLFTTFVGATPASNVTIQNGVIDGNTANTLPANSCWISNCRPAVRIDNNNNGVTAAHDITIQNVTFQNWNNPPLLLQGRASYPLPYNVSILNNKFINSGGNVITSFGFDRNLVIRGNYFSSWGTGLTSNHADPIVTLDYTGYPGTSQFDLDVSSNVFDNTTISPDGFGFVAEIGAAGLGWVTNFTFSNNHMNDEGTNYGGELSGNFVNASVTGNVWTTQGAGELMGSRITATGNSITNGSFVLGATDYSPSTGNVVANNIISIPGQIGVPGTQINQKAIYMAGFATETAVLSNAIQQTALSFSVTGATLTGITFNPRLNTTPPEIVVSGSFGGSVNTYQNWAFTLAGAKNGGNNNTFICVASTSSSMTFVNPVGVSETTLPSGAALSSSSGTTAYVGTFSGAYPTIQGSFNGLQGLNNVSVTGFANANNNVTNTTAIANSLTVLAVTNPNTGVSETHAATITLSPSLNDTIIANNSISMYGSSGACAAIQLGTGDGGSQGPVYNTSVEGNIISATPGNPCGGVVLAAPNSIPLSTGVQIENNNMNGLGIGIWGLSGATNFDDVTVAGNKFVGVSSPTYFPTPITHYRQWNNVTSGTQTNEVLNGNLTVDSSGNIVTPGNLTLAGNSKAASFAGTGVATFAAGTSPGTPVCATSHVCDSVSGTVSFTMGTSTATGILLTVTTSTTRANQPNCRGDAYLAASPYTALPVRLTYTPSTIVFNVGIAPTASAAYELVYSGCGGS
jgi:hypothetical protein